MSPINDRFGRHGEVVATIDIAVPPERVFRALTDPAELTKWWVGAATVARSEDHRWSVDARPRGRWSVASSDAAGRETTVRGEYRVVDPPHVLEFTWQASWDGLAPTIVRCELEPVIVSGAPGTRLRVTHSAPRGAVASLRGPQAAFDWNDALHGLARHLVGAHSHHQPAFPPTDYRKIIA